MGDPRSLREVLDLLCARHRLDIPRDTQQVSQVWERMVPPGVAQHCWVRSLVDGVLELGCDGPLWAQELRMVSEELVARLNGELKAPLVRRIHVTVRRKGEPR